MQWRELADDFLNVGRDLLTVPHPLAVPQPVMLLSTVVTIGVPVLFGGVIVSMLIVVCVIVVGCVAVDVIVNVEPPGSPPGLRDVVLVGPDDPGLVGLKTPVVAVKDVFVLFVLSG